MNCKISRFLFLIFVLNLQACYSFKGISIPPEVSSYYISTFENRAGNAPAGIAQLFSESLKDKIRNGSRLKFTEDTPDIEFDGSISSYQVRSMAPTAGNETAFNRLTISINVNFTNTLSENEEEDWTKSFSWFQDFSNDQDLTSNQDEFIETIFNQLTEDVFNHAFTNW